MDSLGVNFGLLTVQFLFALLYLGWPILSIVTIFAIKKCSLPANVQAVWVLISFVPFLGAIAFWIIRPGASKGSD
jgi:hypothetical protein